MKSRSSHHHRRRSRISRWRPKSVLRRSLVRVTKWELGLMVWSARMAVRRALHSVAAPATIRHR
ncbi:hypothetical protein PUR59_33165 [Streptomyces sp. SP18ES09]|uniref:hypothetical protein n=1 Tax=Streptomyces sp. SP18ES09 TaxID=3002532 RepID=UPI002E796259|nr:hypothetical protein [Streptomyces sp. SP18ES09]MEE1819856.1 hypothetical protein [Streptomyces sp. SP18ES09]